jgi:hypothetical protein
MYGFYQKLTQGVHEKQMSGLVFVRYINDPIICLYSVASINSDEVLTNNFSFVSMGVFMGLHSNMSNLFKILTAYLLIFSKPQPSFSLTEFSTKIKCQTQFQHCFSICHSDVSSYVTATAYVTAVFHHMSQRCFTCFSICFTYVTALCVCYSISYSNVCFSICYSTVFHMSWCFSMLHHCVSAKLQHFQHMLQQLCFSICYSTVFQHML